MHEPPPSLRHRLVLHRQEHVLAGWDELDSAARATLVEQLAGIDFAELESLSKRKDEPHSILPPREDIAPIPVEPVEASPEAIATGERALRNGEVAALCVAGGQGSRLGSDKPKGMFPIGAVSGATLFQRHAETVLALSRRYGRTLPFVVMTSPATDADTQAYFRDNRNFGLANGEIAFFQQGTMPALDFASGRLLLEAPGRLFLSPNGHGGTLTALSESGLLAQLRARGVQHVFYFQVDNPLVKVCDAAFVGRHLLSRSDASSKVVIKQHPEEKVGILAVVNGRCGIIEYSDLPSAMATERAEDGSLRFRAGSPAIHLFSIDFLERVTARDTGLRFHVARKKVPHFDPGTGQQIVPEVENALKFELFVFDALPMADRWLAVETPREEEFAPLKNATGADSPSTVNEAMIRLHRSWLEQAGIATHGHPVEVSPLFALDAAELKTKIPPGFSITGPTYLR